MVKNIVVNGNDYIQEILTWVGLQHDVAGWEHAIHGEQNDSKQYLQPPRIPVQNDHTDSGRAVCVQVSAHRTGRHEYTSGCERGRGQLDCPGFIWFVANKDWVVYRYKYRYKCSHLNGLANLKNMFSKMVPHNEHYINIIISKKSGYGRHL